MAGRLFFAFLLASAAVGVFNIVHQELLSTQAMLAFSLPEPVWVFWYGVNMRILMLGMVILLMAPVCVLVNWRTLGGDTRGWGLKK